MENITQTIEEKIERLPIVSINEESEFQKVIYSDDFNDIFKYCVDNFLPDVLKDKAEVYQRISLYLSITNQSDKMVEDMDQVLYKRPVPSIEEFLTNKFYMGYSNATLYNYWKEQLEDIFKKGSPIRKVIFSGCIGCLTGDTIVATLNGDKTICELLENFNDEWVLSYNIQKNTWEPDKILDVFYTGNRDVYEITLDNDEKIRCTDNHQFLTRNNKWVSIKDKTLVPGLSMMPYYYKENNKGYMEIKNNKRKVIYNHKIKSIVYIGKEDVYDITTERNHNFALKCGVIAHNSGKSTVARKAFIYVLYRILCLRYPRAVFNIDNDATIANIVISMTLKQVYETNLVPFVKLMESMPCFQKVLSQRSFENFNLEDPRCPIPFVCEKSSGTIYFPDNIILTCGSNQGHFTGYNVVNSFCLSGETEVKTIYDDITIEELCKRFDKGEKFQVTGYDGRVSDVINVKKTGEVTDTIKIWFDDKNFVECTPNHLFVIKNPRDNDEHIVYIHDIPFKEAQFLTEEDEIEDK